MNHTINKVATRSSIALASALLSLFFISAVGVAAQQIRLDVPEYPPFTGTVDGRRDRDRARRSGDEGGGPRDESDRCRELHSQINAAIRKVISQ